MVLPESPPIQAPTPPNILAALSQPSDISGNHSRIPNDIQERGPRPFNRRSAPAKNPYEARSTQNIQANNSRKGILRGEHRQRIDNTRSKASKEEALSSAFEEQINAFSNFIENLGVDPESFQINLNGRTQEETQTLALNTVYSIFGTEEGRSAFVETLSRQNKSTLERLTDFKAKAFDEFGLGIIR